MAHVNNLKNSLQYWHFGGNRLLLLTKNTLMKRWQKSRQGPPPPSFGQNPKEQRHFFVKSSLMIKVQHNAFECFSSNMMQGGGREGCQTDAIPTEMWNFFCGRRVYSQFTHNATSHSPFPPQFYYLQTIPMLDTSPPEMQFHKSYRGRCFMANISFPGSGYSKKGMCWLIFY